MKTNFDSLYETFGGTYREENGHLIPNVTLPEQTDYQIGKYGRMHLDYIKQHRRGRYITLLTEGKLNTRLHEIDLEANEMLETIIPRLAIERGIDENLKARDMLRWVVEMNNIKVSAEEIVLREVVLV
ncbi:MAG: TnpV protein [Clostridia bacterium]|nr:TnpV protein [Clostridia bacterium]